MDPPFFFDPLGQWERSTSSLRAFLASISGDLFMIRSLFPPTREALLPPPFSSRNGSVFGGGRLLRRRLLGGPSFLPCWFRLASGPFFLRMLSQDWPFPRSGFPIRLERAHSGSSLFFPDREPCSPCGARSLEFSGLSFFHADEASRPFA